MRILCCFHLKFNLGQTLSTFFAYSPFLIDKLHTCPYSMYRDFGIRETDFGESSTLDPYFTEDYEKRLDGKLFNNKKIKKTLHLKIQANQNYCC